MARNEVDELKKRIEQLEQTVEELKIPTRLKNVDPVVRDMRLRPEYRLFS